MSGMLIPIPKAIVANKTRQFPFDAEKETIRVVFWLSVILAWYIPNRQVLTPIIPST